MARRVLWERPYSCIENPRPVADTRIGPLTRAVPFDPDWDDEDILDEDPADDDVSECLVLRSGVWIPLSQDLADAEWTDADEAGLEEHEERRRERIALANEY